MGIIGVDGGVHIVMPTENKKYIEFICRCRCSVNEPLTFFPSGLCSQRDKFELTSVEN